MAGIVVALTVALTWLTFAFVVGCILTHEYMGFEVSKTTTSQQAAIGNRKARSADTTTERGALRGVATSPIRPEAHWYPDMALSAVLPEQVENPIVLSLQSLREIMTTLEQTGRKIAGLATGTTDHAQTVKSHAPTSAGEAVAIDDRDCNWDAEEKQEKAETHSAAPAVDRHPRYSCASQHIDALPPKTIASLVGLSYETLQKIKSSAEHVGRKMAGLTTESGVLTPMVIMVTDVLHEAKNYVLRRKLQTGTDSNGTRSEGAEFKLDGSSQRRRKSMMTTQSRN